MIHLTFPFSILSHWNLMCFLYSHPISIKTNHISSAQWPDVNCGYHTGFFLRLLLVAQSVMSNSPWPLNCSLPGFSIHRFLQARILECVAIPFFTGSSWPRTWTQLSCIAGRFFNLWVTREAPFQVLRGQIWIVVNILDSLGQYFLFFKEIIRVILGLEYGKILFHRCFKKKSLFFVVLNVFLLEIAFRLPLWPLYLNSCIYWICQSITNVPTTNFIPSGLLLLLFIVMFSDDFTFYILVLCLLMHIFMPVYPITVWNSHTPSL